jgi:hypothetical protein
MVVSWFLLFDVKNTKKAGLLLILIKLKCDSLINHLYEIFHRTELILRLSVFVIRLIKTLPCHNLFYRLLARKMSENLIIEQKINSLHFY